MVFFLGYFGIVFNNELVLGDVGEINGNDLNEVIVIKDLYVYYILKDGGVEVGDGKMESNDGYISKIDVKFDEVVNELKRFFGLKKIIGFKDKVKSKINNFIGGGKDKGVGKDLIEKMKCFDNKVEVDKKDE